MFERPEEFRYPATKVREKVTLAPGETKEARFEAWLATKTAEPQFCSVHPRFQLVRDLHQTGIWNVYEEYRYDCVRPGVFDFCAAWRCPACRCAYALCPPEFHTTSFDTFDTSTPERANALARCREFAAQVNKHGRGFALLVGGPGNGKTHLACSVVRELENGDALYARQGQLTTALRASYGRKDVYMHSHRRSAIVDTDWHDADDDEAGTDEPPTPLEVLQSVRFLVLDEIGCAPFANDERLMLDELLKHRYEEGKPTILISNLALDQLKDFLGDALTDRIKHASGNGKFILQFSGESFRRTTGQEYLERR